MKLELPEDFFLSALQAPPASIRLALEHSLVKSAGTQAVVGARSLALHQYRRLKDCRRTSCDVPRPIFNRYWGGEDNDKLLNSSQCRLWKIDWQGKILHVVYCQWPSSCGTSSQYWVVAPERETANAFILKLARTTNKPGKAMLVFRGGYWGTSTQLYQTVQRTTFDDLVLPADLKDGIRNDFQAFLGAQQTYEKFGLPWRRGALFIGPPGNGKTHCVRALVKELGIPTLYVQSLQHRQLPSEHVLQEVFDRARNLRPCVLIFEDLDSMVNRTNLSFFLNQLDGFEKNVGLIVLATTNHPERIDPAIINRPSRFDRKYHFNLPDAALRADYLRTWKAKLEGHVEWSDESIEQIAKQAEGFSFAYLKELVVSGLMANMSDQDKSFHDHLVAECRFLTAQMRTETKG